MELVKQAHLKVGVYWHVFPSYSEGKDAVWRDKNMLFKIIPPSFIEKVNNQELIIFFKNGSIYQIKGANDPDTLRGAGPLGVVLDEFGTMKYETWHEIVEPIVRANGGWCWFVGTPKGKNHLFEMYQRGQEGHYQWKSWLLKASKSGVIPLDELEESRRTSLESTWNQEYECLFLEGEGSVFRNVSGAATSIPQKPMAEHLYVIGIDLAKVRDYTVLSVFDRTKNNQVYQERFHRLEWPFQKKKIKEIAMHYNNALCVVDGTGIGDPIVDDLLRDGIVIEPFKITEQSKKELVEKLSIWIEQRKCTILPLRETYFEYDNFTYEIGPTGKIRYGARTGFNDDIVISHALAVYGLQPVLREEVKPDVSPIRRHYLEKIRGAFTSEQSNQYDLEAID